MNIYTNFTREYSVSLSPKSFREASVSFSVDYAEYIQAQANKMTWAEQVKSREVQSFSLSYVPLKEITLDTTSIGSVVEINCENAVQGNMNTLQGIEPSIILYIVN